MSIKKNDFLILLIYISLLLYALNPNLFERDFFFNEIFSFIGFFIFLKYLRLKQLDSISILVSFLITYLLLFSLYSFIFLKTDTYMFFRHSVLVYSIFSFSIGYFILAKHFETLNKIGEKISILLLSNLLIGFMFFRASAVATIPLIFLNRFYSKNILHYGIIASLIFAFFYYEGTTQLACLLGFIYLLIIPDFRIFILSSFIMTALLIYTWIDIMSLMNSQVMYQDLHSVFHYTVYDKDGNLLTRLLLWYQLIVEHFPNNLFGIGFGTQIYDINKIPSGAVRPWELNDYNKLIYDSYLIGGHNSFIYLFSRTGIAPFFILMSIYYLVFKNFYEYREELIQNKRIIFFYAFFIISISATLNVILESSIHASLYWILLGTVTHSIIYTQKEKNENPHHP